MCKKQQGQDGQALLLVIFVVLIVSMTAIALINLAGSSKKASLRQYERIQATYISEAGIEKLLALLKYDKNWRDVRGILNEYAGGEIEQLSVTESYSSSGDLEIMSLGRYGHTRKTLKVRIKIKPALIFSSYSSLINEQFNDTGNIKKEFFLPSVLIKDKELYKSIAQSYGKGHYFSGDAVFSTQDLLGIQGLYYVDGNVLVNGIYSGRATIMATGDITITSNLTTSSIESNSLGLISYKNIKVGAAEKQTDISAILFNEGYLKFYGKVNVVGSIVTSQLKLGEEPLNFKYSKELLMQIPPGLPVDLQVISWKEAYPIF